MAVAPNPASPGAGKSDREWERASRYDRRAEVLAVDWLTSTGTVRIRCRVTDGRPFDFDPGHFVAIREEVAGIGARRSPYCILSAPGDDRGFDMLLRVFPEGPLSQHLAGMARGDEVHFRGPSGRSMMPKDPDSELIGVATGVGISPLISLCRHLASVGDQHRIRLYWGLRLTEDICLTEDLDQLVELHPGLTYQISLSQPPPGWAGLRGRVTESVPPCLETLGAKRFYLTGNGAMVEELEVALTRLGVDRRHIHEERFFNIRHQPDDVTLDAILARFPAGASTEGAGAASHELTFHLERDVKGRPGPPPSNR